MSNLNLGTIIDNEKKEGVFPYLSLMKPWSKRNKAKMTQIQKIGRYFHLLLLGGVHDLERITYCSEL